VYAALSYLIAHMDEARAKEARVLPHKGSNSIKNVIKRRQIVCGIPLQLLDLPRASRYSVYLLYYCLLYYCVLALRPPSAAPCPATRLQVLSLLALLLLALLLRTCFTTALRGRQKYVKLYSVYLLYGLPLQRLAVTWPRASGYSV
jgi:hypothetical protein